MEDENKEHSVEDYITGQVSTLEGLKDFAASDADKRKISILLGQLDSVLNTGINAIIDERNVAMNAIKTGIDDEAEKLWKELAKAKEDVRREVVKAENHKRDFSAKLHEDFAKHKQELEAVKSAVKSSMELGAAHDHWSKKASEHAGRAEARGQDFNIALFVVAVLSVGYLWLVTNQHLMDLVTPSGFPNIGGLFLLSAPVLLAVWGLRFFQNEYLEERMAAIDASARATMAQTFVALLASGADQGTDKDFSNEQRLLILSTLFSPPIMDKKHDPSPSFGPELIAKVLSKAPNKQG